MGIIAYSPYYDKCDQHFNNDIHTYIIMEQEKHT